MPEPMPEGGERDYDLSTLNATQVRTATLRERMDGLLADAREYNLPPREWAVPADMYACIVVGRGANPPTYAGLPIRPHAERSIVLHMGHASTASCTVHNWTVVGGLP